MIRLLFVVFVIAFFSDGCAHVPLATQLSSRLYPEITEKSAPGDTVWAVNAATKRWQLCYLDRDTLVRFIPGTEAGPVITSAR